MGDLFVAVLDIFDSCCVLDMVLVFVFGRLAKSDEVTGSPILPEALVARMRGFMASLPSTLWLRDPQEQRLL